jgi:hypothetical protein
VTELRTDGLFRIVMSEPDARNVHYVSLNDFNTEILARLTSNLGCSLVEPKYIITATRHEDMQWVGAAVLGSNLD